MFGSAAITLGIGHILVSCIVVITAVCYDDCCFCTCITVMLGTQLPVFTARENECHFGHSCSRAVLSRDSRAFCKQKIIIMTSLSIMVVRLDGPCSRVSPKRHPCSRAVNTGSVHRALNRSAEET